MALPFSQMACAIRALRPLNRQLKQCGEHFGGFRSCLEPSSNVFYTQVRTKKKSRMPLQKEENENIVISCTRELNEPYTPTQGDGKLSILTSEGIGQRKDQLLDYRKTRSYINKIKEHETDFDPNSFAQQAQSIYIDANTALQDYYNKKEHLLSLVTEFCYQKMVEGVENRTLKWSFLESIEPPKAVQVRVAALLTEANTYGQVTVRFHSKQILAIYDRFGRLIQGSETAPRDVLEYVVFEKALALRYGRWRIHAKIVPPWAKTRDAPQTTILLTQPEHKSFTETNLVNSSTDNI